MWVEKLLGMSLHKVLQAADEFLPFTFVLFLGLPLACWFCGTLLRKKNGRGPLKAAYLLLLLLTALPAIAFTLFAAYISFFSDENLPDVSLYCYVLPFLAFVLALVLAGANRDLLSRRAGQPEEDVPKSASPQ